ncbi:MAG: thioredoxin domain-containing protein [Nitrospirae bacterium]|nr:thioredoxin domain-containing protein [Nitrospirota bacterium]
MANRLKEETSPYLRQHAHNPVDWYPWGPEAFERARQEEKPVLLSIGYAACHWCHVMAHESFENPAVAGVMNAFFVNIKVDREERPDLDQIYQMAHTMITRRNGGWPLTMFLTPTQVPFAGGTYFPAQPRFGLPGFVQVLEQIRDFYRDHREELGKTDHPILQYLGQTNPVAKTGEVELDLSPSDALVNSLKSRFDPEYGGFGGAPKFPHAMDLSYLLRRYQRQEDSSAVHMAALTLSRMKAGGIWDHIGGGFARYSVDDRWLIPHFEKMLYDNALLLESLALAARVSQNSLFSRTAEELVEWLFREMRSAEGVFYSSLDADSEGEEGRFYVFQVEEVRRVLTDGEFRIASEYYGLSGPPNFEGHAWHLHEARSIGDLSRKFGLEEAEIESRIKSSRQKLFDYRSSRVRPGLDDKILASWNALMAKALLYAGRLFGKDEWVAAGRKAIDFIGRRMWKNGSLMAVFSEKEHPLPAYLDDYAFLLSAVLESLRVDFRPEDLDFSTKIADILLEEFQDEETGGFYFTGKHHETLIHRPKNGHDGALPSGNAVATQALLWLGNLTGHLPYHTAADRSLRLYFSQMKEQPAGYTTMTAALETYSASQPVLLLSGPQAKDWKGKIEQEMDPESFVIDLTEAIRQSILLPEGMRKHFPENRTTGWICRGTVCLPPVDTFESLRAGLAAKTSSYGENV